MYLFSYLVKLLHWGTMNHLKSVRDDHDICCKSPNSLDLELDVVACALWCIIHQFVYQDVDMLKQHLDRTGVDSQQHGCRIGCANMTGTDIFRCASKPVVNSLNILYDCSHILMASLAYRRAMNVLSLL